MLSGAKLYRNLFCWGDRPDWAQYWFQEQLVCVWTLYRAHTAEVLCTFIHCRCTVYIVYTFTGAQATLSPLYWAELSPRPSFLPGSGLRRLTADELVSDTSKWRRLRFRQRFPRKKIKNVSLNFMTNVMENFFVKCHEIDWDHYGQKNSDLIKLPDKLFPLVLSVQTNCRLPGIHPWDSQGELEVDSWTVDSWPFTRVSTFPFCVL